MHKKLEAELISLAHGVLQMKNKDEASALRDKARLLYEKLSVLAFVDDYVATSTNLEVSKEEILQKMDTILNTKDTTPTTKKVEEKLKDKIEDNTKEEKTIFEPKFDSVKIDLQSLKTNQISSKEEFRDAISADKTASLFDEDEEKSTGKKTLNDKWLNKTITVGLNDRIAFVNNLFNHNQNEFNRVLSQLNTFKTEKEAKDFIINTVKSDYDWNGKEDYEERLLTLIERKFS